MTKLQTLAIGFMGYGTGTSFRPAALSELIPEGMRWDYLQQFNFSCIEATRQEIVDFIRRQSSTVKRIHLKDMHLLRQSWHVFLPQLRALAEEMSLDEVIVSGQVSGTAESNHLPWRSSAGPYEDFYLGNPDFRTSPEPLLDSPPFRILRGKPLVNPLEVLYSSNATDDHSDEV